MAKASRRPSQTKPGKPPPAAPLSHVAPAAVPGASGARRSPADELEARLAEPEEGILLHALEERVSCPGLLHAITDAGQRILDVLGKHDSTDLLRAYESLEFDIAEVRERAAFGLGYEHGAADGRAEAFRALTPGLGERAQRLADQTRALVVNEGLSPLETNALVLETVWVLLFAKPAPSRARSVRTPDDRRRQGGTGRSTRLPQGSKVA